MQLHDWRDFLPRFKRIRSTGTHGGLREQWWVTERPGGFVYGILWCDGKDGYGLYAVESILDAETLVPLGRYKSWDEVVCAAI